MRLTKLVNPKEYGEPVWHIIVALVIALGLQLLLKNNLVFGSKYIVACLEALLIIILLIPGLAVAIKRLFAIGLIVVITLGNLTSLFLVIKALFSQGVVDGRALLLSSVAIYLTNIIVFGILYWEMDDTQPDVPDFQFPQFTDSSKHGWKPTFFDYVYVSVTNAAAFSPTDTMPLTHRAKLLMTVQSLTALITVALVAARAVNILS